MWTVIDLTGNTSRLEVGFNPDSQDARAGWSQSHDDVSKNMSSKFNKQNLFVTLHEILLGSQEPL